MKLITNCRCFLKTELRTFQNLLLNQELDCKKTYFKSVKHVFNYKKPKSKITIIIAFISLILQNIRIHLIDGPWDVNCCIDHRTHSYGNLSVH